MTSSKQSDEPKYQNVTNFEDLLEIIGPNGRRNIILFICCALGGMTNPFVTFTYTFLGATPDHWCEVDALKNTSWTTEQIKNISIPLESRYGEVDYSSCLQYDLDYDSLASLSFENAYEKSRESLELATTTCSQRSFAESEESIVTKWNLVCERRAIYATVQSAIHGGVLMGCFILGFALDRFGRYGVYKMSVILHILIGLSIAFSPNVVVFILLKMASSVTVIGFYMSGFVIAIEFTTQRQRSLVATYYVIPWAFGIMIASGIAYYIRPWYYLQVALTLPNIILLFSVWYLTESPRWLISKGRYDRAYEILNSFAVSNGRNFPRTSALNSAMIKIHQSIPSSSTKQSGTFLQRIKQLWLENTILLRSRNMRKTTLIMFFCWFSASLVYYAISFGSPAIGANPYLFMFLGGAVELVSYLMLWPAAVFLGRRKALVSSYLFCCVTIFLTLALVSSVPKSELVWLKMILALSGKFAITANFHLLWVYTAELYTTSHRSLAVGQASTMARIGSMCSSFFNDILLEAAFWAPSAVFGSMSLICGCLGFILVETSSRRLDEEESSSS